MTVLVVGGGITGLSAAHALAREKVPTLLLEASDRLGGKVRTERGDGFVVESGPDSFVSYRPAAVELCRELGIGDAIIRPNEPRTVQVRVGGRFVRLPDGMGLVLPTRMRPFVETDMFSPLEKLLMARDLVMPRDGSTGDLSVGAFLRRRLGRPVVERLAGPLIGGVYGTPIDELSLDAVVPQLRAAERAHRSLLLASLADGRARRGRPGGSPFVTLAGGTGQLVETLAERVLAAPGVEVRLGASAVSVESGEPPVVRLASGETLRPEAVILAAPAPASADLLESVAPAATSHLRSIPYGSTGVVTLAYREDQFPRPLTGHGFLVADGEDLTISACTWSSLKWAGRAPEGTVLVRAFLGSSADTLLRGPDEGVVGATEGDVRKTTGVRGAPILTRVARWPGAMPHYTVGHLERVAAAVAALEASPRLILAGSAYRGVGLPDCIAQGRVAADRVVELLGARPAEARVA